MKSSQSNFNLRSPGSYFARSYLIATVLQLNTSLFQKIPPSRFIDFAIFAPPTRLFQPPRLLKSKEMRVCAVEKSVKFFDSMMKKRDFLKISNLLTFQKDYQTFVQMGLSLSRYPPPPED